MSKNADAAADDGATSALTSLASTPARITVLLVDDNHQFLQLLSQFLQLLSRFLRTRCPDEISVVGMAEDAELALGLAVSCRPRVAILDRNMPGRGGLEAVSDFRQALPTIGIVVLTLFDYDEYRCASLRSGANEFVSKSRLEADLLPAIRRAVTGAAPGPALI